MLHGDIQPAQNASVPYGGVQDYGMAAKLPGRALGVHQTAVAKVHEGASHATTTGNGPCMRHCVDVLCSVAAVGLCRATTGDGVRRGGCTSVATAVASACGGKASRPIHRTIAWGRVGGDLREGGSGSGAHLDRRDLRYQRKQARIIRRALVVVVNAGAVGGHACVGLVFASLVQAVVGAPGGMAVHVPPVELPVRAVLSVFLGPAGPREHAEPEGVAVPVLPSVGHAIIISEHAAAEDADAVEGVPFPYDRRHAATVSAFLRLASGARIPAAALAIERFSGRRDLLQTEEGVRACERVASVV
jgi:hypothetical protein